jgi:UDP-GlcNAc3NAcA epimerase
MPALRSRLPAEGRSVRILSVVGARPQFVKAAIVSRALRGAHDEMLVHTGQHYDFAMSESLFHDLELAPPDINLGVGSAPHAEQTAEMMRRLEPVAVEERPAVVLVYGDTNSTLAAALVAAKLVFPDGRRPWLAHVEAGLRSFNRSMPEERNRVVVDHLADLLLAPTVTAMQNLAGEGLSGRSELVGDVMSDAFVWAATRSDAHLPAVAAAQPGYLLLTLHRAENVDDPAALGALLAALPTDRPVIFPVHPRTRASIERGGLVPPGNVQQIGPVGYLAMVALERHAAAIATDSGGVQKEAYLAGVPCITLRHETEWVETVTAGWNRLAGAGPALREALADPHFMDRGRSRPDLFGDGQAAGRVVMALNAVQSTTVDREAAAPVQPAEVRPS